MGRPPKIIEEQTITPPTAKKFSQPYDLKKLTSDEIKENAPHLYEAMRKEWVRSFRLEALMDIGPEDKSKILEFIMLGFLILITVIVLFKK